MILAVANTKGGVGKTTTVMFLAQAFSSSRRVRVIDADPQGSASEWAARAKEQGAAFPFAVDPGNASMLRRLTDDSEVVTIVDTPPGDAQTIIEAAARATLTVIPTAASGLDLERTWETYDALAGKSRTVLITLADKRTVLHQQAVEAMHEAETALFNTVISKRQAIRNTYGVVPTELHAYDDLAREIEGVLA